LVVLFLSIDKVKPPTKALKFLIDRFDEIGFNRVMPFCGCLDFLPPSEKYQ